MPSHQAEVMRYYTEKKMNEQQQPKSSEEQEQEREGRTPPDPELHAMKRIRAILADLPVGARGRVLAYVVDRAQEERWAGAEGMVAAPPIAGLAKACRSE